MIEKFKRSLIAFAVSLFAVMGFTVFLAPTQSVSAFNCPSTVDNVFLQNFPTWYRGLQCKRDSNTGRYSITGLKDKNIGEEIVFKIALNVTDMLLQITGIVAAVFVAWSGIKYMIARGYPEATSKAIMGLWQAAIGMFFAIMASTIVGFVVSQISGYNETGVPVVSAEMIITNGFNLLYWLAGIIAVAMILFSSFQYLTSKGFEDKTLKARRSLIDSVIGLIIVLIAAVITNFIINAISGNLTT